MPELDQKIAELEARLDRLVRTQVGFQQEISTIRTELTKLRSSASDVQRTRDLSRNPQIPPMWPGTAIPPSPGPSSPTTPLADTLPPFRRTGPPTGEVPPPTFGMPSAGPGRSSTRSEGKFSDSATDHVESKRGNLERFVGRSLIALVGIVILIVGVGIGAKFAIDNGWISPLMRIIFGYAVGFGLLGTATILKKKYLNFSAVLLSGGMAIMYFVTYFAYSYYWLMPQYAAFTLMAVFTIFTVAAALLYGRQVIAHIGLVGAYAVPFLLSDDSGNYLFLFTYMAIINGGILAIGVVKAWKPLFYTSFGFTWLIYLAWFVSKYSPVEHFYVALAFLGVFFTTFYATKIIHRVVHIENDDLKSLVSIIVTALVFYLFCFAISDVNAGIVEYSVFFGYLAFFGLAILFTSFRFFGRLLVYVSYPFTWLIFGVWFVKHYQANEFFALAAIFAGVFFAVYYAATLIYRLATDDIGMAENTALVMTNSFIFYGFGYAILDSRESLRPFEGLFTASHAIFHLIVAQVVSWVKSTAVDVIQVLAILIITFTTIAVPVQMDGNSITLVWTVEAAALFWFGRFRSVRLFEYLSLPIMALATGSLFVDWIKAFAERISDLSEFHRQPLMNGDFVTAIVFVAAFTFIYFVNQKKNHEPAISSALVRPLGLVLGTLTTFVLYNTFRIEIANYFHLQMVGAESVHELSSLAESSLTRAVDDIVRFNFIWQLNYTMAFLIGLAVINLQKARSAIVAYAGIALSAITLLLFVSAGMYLFDELRISYMIELPDVTAGPMNIAIRYISYVFAVGLLASLYRTINSTMVSEVNPAIVRELAWDGLCYLTIFIIVSFELINIMVQLHIPDGGKLGISILWGVYALTMTGIGIAWNKKHLRIAAIVLLGVTLIKLFLYDVADLPTIPKTILFVSLGVLLLIVSFLYNKFATRIFSHVQPDAE